MRILFVQQRLGPIGGGNAVTAWMIEALKAEHDLSLLSSEAPDWQAIDRHFGTRIGPGQVCVFVWHGLLERPVDRSRIRLDFLRGLRLLQEARRRAPDFDLLISADNEGDLGDRGIQYVHFPKFEWRRPAVDLRWFHVAPLVAAYRGFSRIATGTSPRRIRGNLTLINSEWTAAVFRRIHGVEPLVVHPPVVGDFPDVPWPQRRDDFVCVGRISPEKRLDLVIDVVAKLREQGRSVNLHIAGTVRTGAYARGVVERIGAAGDWLQLHENLSRADLSALVAAQRYGIHAMEDEHFGMSVAEMARAGCVVFAPNSGGQTEILGDERLLFEDRDDAVRKIANVLDNPDLQREHRTALGQRTEQFGVEDFQEKIRALVRDFAGV